MFAARNLFVAALVGAAACGQPAAAHHSFGMFDADKQVTITGTVRQWMWTNPHPWLYVMVPDGAKEVEWGMEGPGIGGLSQRGWSRTALKPGDKVTVLLNPRKDGKPGGALVTITLPSGGVLSTRGGGPPPGERPAPSAGN